MEKEVKDSRGNCLLVSTVCLCTSEVHQTDKKEGVEGCEVFSNESFSTRDIGKGRMRIRGSVCNISMCNIGLIESTKQANSVSSHVTAAGKMIQYCSKQ